MQVVRPVTPDLERCREDKQEFKVTLGYTEHLRMA